MSAESTQRAAELAALIARHSTLPPHQIAAHVTHLQRIAWQLKALAERQCNGYSRERLVGRVVIGAPLPVVSEWDQEAADRDDARFAKLAGHAGTLCTALNFDLPRQPVFKVEVGGDPRGPCLRLRIEGERGDGWDQAADGTGSFAIY